MGRVFSVTKLIFFFAMLADKAVDGVQSGGREKSSPEEGSEDEEVCV